MNRHPLPAARSGAAYLRDDLQAYLAELRLLRHVPLSYLVPDEALLPAESIRFFCVDQNWTAALCDGALSIGRTTEADRAADRLMLAAALKKADSALHLPRLSRMHKNHVPRALAVYRHSGKLAAGAAETDINAPRTCGELTGFIARSELVRAFNGLEIRGYDGETELPLLRLDTLAADTAIGLFDGQLTRLCINEPKTVLSYGLAEGEAELVPKDITDANFGQPLAEHIDIAAYTNASGRLCAEALAAKLAELLCADVGSAVLAYELIAVAGRAEFTEVNDK